jgi:hypothetical protein
MAQSVPPAVITRTHALQHGHTDSSIRHKLATGIWIRLRKGVYIDTAFPAAEKAHAIEASWLQRCGAGAALSFQTAAAHHGFDSTEGWPTSICIAYPMHQRPPVAEGVRFVRSRTLTPDQTVKFAGMTYTSRMRTLIDVLSTLDLLEGERVLESALRGPDPRRPDQWRANDLDELVRFCRAHPRQPGARQVLTLLAQRPPGCRPTGSISETAALQAMRAAGYTDVDRQPRVIADDEHGNPREHFLDLYLRDESIDVEVDGNNHLEPKRKLRDLQRDRRLSKGMVVVRCTATEALYNSGQLIATIREEIARQAHERRNLPADFVGRHSLQGQGLDLRIVSTKAA